MRREAAWAHARESGEGAGGAREEVVEVADVPGRTQVEEGVAVEGGRVEADARATSERVVAVVGPRPCCG